MDFYSTHCLVCGYQFSRTPAAAGPWEIRSAAEVIGRRTYSSQNCYRLSESQTLCVRGFQAITGISTVIFDPMQKTYSLSGISEYVMSTDYDNAGFFFPRIEFFVPKDRNLALTGGCPGDSTELIVRVPPAASLEFRHDCHSGCPVHMRCWKFVERIIGPKAEENLCLLFHVLRDRYRECEYAKRKCPRSVTFSRGMLHLPTYKSKANMRRATDPFECKDVRKLIQKSVSRLAKGANEERRAKSPVQNCLLTRFPLDVQFIILDLLDHRDISKARRAIYWPMVQHYWRYRAPKAFAHELQDITENDHDVDWEYLCLGVEKLSEKRPLRCRRKVFELLQGPRDVFYKLLKEKQMN
jgi:hypothetical protein